jgi:hypothetical protein
VLWLADVSLLLGVVGIFGFLYFVVGKGHAGLWERVGSYPIIVWCMVLGFGLIRWSRASKV